MPSKRARVHLVWVPEWEGKLKCWAIKFIIKNKWRCDGLHDVDDLLQDAYLLFLKLADRYPRVVEPQHFMALFKTAMNNKMHDHARYMRRKRLVIVETHEDVTELGSRRIGEVTNAGYLNAVLAEAPQELKLALALLETHPEALREKHKIRENLNMKLRRILGVGADFDFAGVLKSLLTR